MLRNFLSKSIIFVATMMITIMALSFMPSPLAAQTDVATGPLAELKNILAQWYITEAVFMATILFLTEWVVKLTKLTNTMYIKLVSFGLTLLAAIVGFIWDLGIFAEMGIVSVIWFAVVKSFAEIGAYEWLKEILPGISKSKKALR